MISKNPMKRHSCKEDSSLGWYNLDKSKSVKEQICTEFDNCKRKADFEFEMQEQYKELQSSAGVKRKKSKLIYELKAHNDHNSLNVDQENQNTEETDKETSLVEVQLTVKTSNRSANVPFVCLTSKLIGETIIGYPLQIEELSDGFSETVPPMKESATRKLVWRTSKRTPVCYVQAVKSGENEKDKGSISIERENGVGMKEKPLVKLMNPKKFNGGDAPLRRTCVSVELVFSKIFAAIG